MNRVNTMGEVVDVMAVLVLAALAGNEFAIAAFVHPVLTRLDDATHSRAVQPLARITGRAMPGWYAAALVLSAACILFRTAGSASWWLSLSAAVLVGGSILFTFIGPLPINSRVAKWDLNDLPTGWRTDRSRWDRMHQARVAVLVVAASLLAAAVVSGRN